MDILWVALGICAVVVFVFYVLAQHWQRLLVRHAWTVRELTERLATLEEIATPDFLRKVDESASPPLEQVCTFRLCLSDRFFKEVIRSTPEEMAFVRKQGKLLGSVKIERWRSHRVVTIAEILPQSKSASWQMRSFEIFPSAFPGKSQSVALWELSLGPASRGAAPEKSRSVELRLHDDSLVLYHRGHQLPAEQASTDPVAEDEEVLTSVPLDTPRLARYRVPDETGVPKGFESVSGAETLARRDSSRLSFYEYEDANLGLDWQLCLRTLVSRHEGDRPGVLDSGEIRKVS